MSRRKVPYGLTLDQNRGCEAAAVLIAEAVGPVGLLGPALGSESPGAKWTPLPAGARVGATSGKVALLVAVRGPLLG